MTAEEREALVGPLLYSLRELLGQDGLADDVRKLANALAACEAKLAEAERQREFMAATLTATVNEAHDQLAEVRAERNEWQRRAETMIEAERPPEPTFAGQFQLAPCVVLTREEAEFIRKAFLGQHEWPEDDRALALLTPEERDADA